MLILSWLFFESEVGKYLETVTLCSHCLWPQHNPDLFEVRLIFELEMEQLCFVIAVEHKLYLVVWL